jgi:hypothetical protein
MIDYIYIVLLFIHIGAVIGWVGAAMFGNIVLSPLGPKLSAATRADFGKLIAPQSSSYSLRMALVALVAGALLYAYVEFVVPTSEAISSLGDPFIGVGALIGLIVPIIFTWVQLSTTKKTGAISAQIAQSQAQAGVLGAKLEELQKKSTLAGRLALIALFIVIVLMVIGTNVS